MSRVGASVLLVDDHPIVLHGLGALLRAQGWIERVVESTTAHEASRLITVERPDVAVIDLGLPDGDGVDLVRQVLRAAPECRVLIFTTTRDDHALRSAFGAGAKGYVLKGTESSAVVRAVRTVLDGGVVLGPDVDYDALVSSVTALRPPLDQLTSAQIDLLTGLAKGWSTAKIARESGVTTKTVRNRVSHLLGALKVTDRVQAVLLAREQGLGER